MTTTDVVLYEIEERIATITLNRPDARNALSGEVLGRLPEVLREADSDDGVDVVILTGADPAFCAGLDLKELGSADGLRPSAGEMPVADRAVAGNGPFPPMSKPLIGAINGVA